MQKAQFLSTMSLNRQEKANAGNVTQKIHQSLKQSTLIHTQTHTYLQSTTRCKKVAKETGCTQCARSCKMNDNNKFFFGFKEFFF